MVVHITFAGVLILQKDAQPWMRFIFELIFLKHANDGVTQAILGFDREKFYCNQMYCHFQKPDKFLSMIEAPADPIKGVFAFPLIFLVVHLLTYYNMNKRLKRTN